MRATRRFWAVAGLAAALAALAVLLARPRLLVGAAALVGWLLAAQYAFTRALARTRPALDVEQSLDREHVPTGEPVTVTLSVSSPTPLPLRLDVEASLPVAAAGPSRAGRSVVLGRGGHAASTTFPVTVPLAGRVTFGRPAVVATDPLGLVTETLRLGPTPSLTVEPRGPRDVHVGEGGQRLAAAFGDHATGEHGPGLSPAELREYAPGDPAGRIDWKATARLAGAFVRETEAETDRVTVLVVDHRAAMGAGPPGETKLDYARQVALAVAASAAEHDDPLGLYAVGDGGLTVARPPEANPGAYAAVRRDLHDLAPTAGPRGGAGPTRGPADAGELAARLAGEKGPFAERLRPYLGEAAAYVSRVDDAPLFRTVRTAVGRVRGSRCTVLLTDDADRAQLVETVKVARRGNARVLALLAPEALFSAGGLADLEAAYDRYRDFEAFRRELDRLERVSAYEVAPGDRLAAVLGAGRRRRVAGRRA